MSLPKISRHQLIITSLGLDGVRVRNIGRCPMLVRGEAAMEADLISGQAVQLGQQLLLLCIYRPTELPAPPPGYPSTAFGAPDGFGIIGESAVTWKLRQQLGLVGPRREHVLLVGPTGSGKELSARAVHALSNRTGKRLIARNAATIPESIIDAELFGNSKNYPNPGMAERHGLIGEADGSTLFLDEIAELPPAMQAHLLRVLDEGEYHRLGESVARRSNFRLVAATNRPISELKEDFLARFGLRVEVPDLNTRLEDIPLLAHQMMQKLAAESDASAARPLRAPEGRPAPEMSIAVCRQLLERTYTSHVRELERLLLQAFVEGGGAGIKEIQRLAREGTGPSGKAEKASRESAVLDSHPVSLSPARIQAVLDAHNGRIDAAYRALGLKNRFALGRLIAKYGLEVRRHRSRSRPGPTGQQRAMTRQGARLEGTVSGDREGRQAGRARR